MQVNARRKALSLEVLWRARGEAEAASREKKIQWQSCNLKHIEKKLNENENRLKISGPHAVTALKYIILFFVSKFGTNAIAGYSAAVRYEGLLFLPLLGLNTAVITIVGQNYGAKQFNRIIET